MSQSVARCPSTTTNFQSARRRHRTSDVDKISPRFGKRASTKSQMVKVQLQRRPTAVAAFSQHCNSRKGDLQIAPAVLETAAPCSASDQRLPLQPNTKAARRYRYS